MEYLRDNTKLDSKTWEKAEKLLIEAGALKQGGLMQDVREIIREKGRWEGERKGRKERDKEVVFEYAERKGGYCFYCQSDRFF